MQKIDVKPNEFAYLKVQRGDLDHFAGDFEQWRPAYEERLAYTFRTIRDYLPDICTNVLDIGSGLGGINALVHEFYKTKMGTGPKVHLLDGENEPPKVLRHNKPFNDMSIATNFLRRNGVQDISFSTPWRMSKCEPFDLVMSFAAWCFHIHPGVYLDYTLKHSRPQTVFIIDVRRDFEWREILRERFIFRTTVEIGKKYDRVVLKRR